MSMRRIYFILCILLISTQSHRYGITSVYGTETGFVSFHSDAPLELITASSKKLRCKLDIERKLFAFTIKLTSFTGFNNPLQQEHFNENYMESSLFPNATFSGKIIEDIDFTADGNYTLRAKGNLMIHGVTEERIIKGDVTISRTAISIHSDFTVLLSDHNIAIPKIVHEKLASEIKVTVKADLIPQ